MNIPKEVTSTQETVGTPYGGCKDGYINSLLCVMLNVKGQVYDNKKKHDDMCDVEKLISYPSEPNCCDERDEHSAPGAISIYLLPLEKKCDVVLGSECLNEGDHVYKHIGDGSVPPYLV